MRGSPPCDVALCRFGVWRAAIALIGLAVVSALAAWAVSTPSGLASSPWIVAAAAIGSVCAVVVCRSLWRPPAGHLRWDGQAWTFTPVAAGDPIPGDLIASVDLDVFLLLRFTPSAVGGRRARPLWLPAQRRGLEREWHAFRCAVHSPRPAAGPAAPDAPAP